MLNKTLAAVDSVDMTVFGILILLIFLLLFTLFAFSVWASRTPGSMSPYSRQPMRKGGDLPYSSKVKVLRFLYDMHQYDNRIFEFETAAVCRETGRIFPKVVTWYGVIKLDWTFLQKRYPGKYVSWGSLTEERKEFIKDAHEPLTGYQTEFSSAIPQPKLVEAKYAFAKPGPLYVDIETMVLLGWQCVPDSDLEVLVVRKPINLIPLGASQQI